MKAESVVCVTIRNNAAHQLWNCVVVGTSSTRLSGSVAVYFPRGIRP